MLKETKDEIKAIFFDIDGTYYDHVSDCVLPSSIEAVKRLQARGIKVALCSGRPLAMAKELDVFDGIAWDGFIGSAGNTVYDKTFLQIQNFGFSSMELAKIFALAKEKGICLYVNGSNAFLTMNDEQAIDILKQFHVKIPSEIRDWKIDDGVEMISAFKGYDYDYSDFLTIPSLRVQKSSGCIVDLIKEGVNKTTGIQRLLKHWGLEGGKYMAFGDSLNDKEMLEDAHLSVAMENGDPQLYAYADIVCGPSNQDSIYATLNKLGLID